MDPHICFWTSLENHVCTRCFISAVYGKGTSLHYSTNLFHIKRFRVLWLILLKINIQSFERGFDTTSQCLKPSKKKKMDQTLFCVNSWTRPVQLLQQYLWSVVKICLILSLGQAQVERWFNDDKSLNHDNVSGELLVVLCTVIDRSYEVL